MSFPIINSPGYEIPEKNLLIIPAEGHTREECLEVIQPLSGQRTRDWWNSHFYYCLPLTVGNQYGFVIRAANDFSVMWNGGTVNSDVKLYQENINPNSIQNYDPHFGSGILTVQNRMIFRTPPGVNIITMQPPNFVKHGIMHMVGVVEADNLRRDFTFNLKITEPNLRIDFKKGDLVGAFMCVPRHFVDEFKITFADEIYSKEQIEWEYEIEREFCRARMSEDKKKSHEAGRLYFKGVDAWGNEFPDHQITTKKFKNE